MDEQDKYNQDLWKWSVFYNNPKDPALFPYKSGGVRNSVAFNWGHKRAPLVIGLFLGLVVGCFAYVLFFMKGQVPIGK